MLDSAHQSFIRWLKVAFAVELVLIGVVTATAILSLHALRAEVRAIVDHENRRLALVQEMRALVRERLMRGQMLLMEADPFKRDEYRMQVQELAGRFIQTRSELEKRASEPREKALLQASRAGNIAVAAVVDRILEFHEQGQMDLARRLWLAEAVPRQQGVLDRLDDLRALYTEKVEAAKSRAQAHYERTVALLTGLGFMAGILSLVIATLVLERSRRDRQRLLDEMAAHGETTAQLRTLNAHLEREVQARTEALQRTADLLLEAQRIGHMGHWEWEVDSGRLVWSPEIYRLFGLDPQGEPLTYEGFLTRVHPDDRERVVRAVEAALAGDEPYHVVHRIRMPDGSVRYMEERGAVERDDDGRPVRMVGTVQDVTENEQMRHRLWELAHRDPLTGLPNRLLMMDRLGQALALGRRHGHGAAVALFDLDGFKEVNDRFGHAAGDALLIQVGHRVSQVLRETDTLCRYAGDEFVAILPHVRCDKSLAEFVGRIQGCFEEEFRLEGRSIRVRASIGVACFPDHGQSVDELLRHADAAMYRAKGGGGLAVST